MSLFIVYELNRWSKDLNSDFSFKNCFFGAVKLTTNPDLNKYSYSGCSIGFDSCSLFSLTNFDWSKNVVIFGVHISSSVHIDNEKKEILVLGEGPTQRLNNTTIAVEAKYSINFSR